MKRLTCAALSTVLSGGIVLGLAPGEAHAATSIRVRALHTAAAQKGDPYKRGGTGPYYFDCSGLTSYSYKKNGKDIPRTAQGQYNRYPHVSAGSRQAGDLVFFFNSSGAYHVGIYAGGGKIWNANRGRYRGYKVVLAPIGEYDGAVRYARVNG